LVTIACCQRCKLKKYCPRFNFFQGNFEDEVQEVLLEVVEVLLGSPISPTGTWKSRKSRSPLMEYLVNIKH